MSHRVRVSADEVPPGGTVARVPWGPDFGEGSGSDGVTFRIGLPAPTMGSVAVAAELPVGIHAQMSALAGVYVAQPVGIHVSMDLAFANTKTIGLQASMPQLALANTKTLGSTLTMPQLALANTKPVGLHLSGTALGAPFWQSIDPKTSAALIAAWLFAKPAALGTGDLMVVSIGRRSPAADDITAPSGWTQILRNAGTDTDITSFQKIATSSEPVDYNFTWPAALASFASLQHIIGVDQSAPINVSGGASGSATDPVAPSVTTTVANCLRIVTCCQVSLTDITYTPPASHVERAELNGNGLLGAHSIDGEIATRIQTAAGASSAQTMDSTALIATAYAAQHIAIAPGPYVMAA